MSFISDANSLKAKLHLQSIPVPLRIGLVVLCAAILFILFQGLWQVSSGNAHPLLGFSQSSGQGGSGQDGSGQDGITISSDSAGQTDGSQEQVGQESGKASVHIVGCINKPGLYEVSSGARLQEVVSAAGGFTKDADETSINLARVVEDGEQVVVGSKSGSGAVSGANAGTESSGASGASAAARSAGGATSGSKSSTAAQGLVNINTADVATLTTLSGVGEATAKKIVADREKNGPFKTKKDITRVSGIGEKKYEALKDFITV